MYVCMRVYMYVCIYVCMYRVSRESVFVKEVLKIRHFWLNISGMSCRGSAEE